MLTHISHEFNFATKKWAPLVQQVSRLAEVAQSEPQAAHAAFTHGLIGKWTFLTITSSSSIAKHLQPLEDTIRLRLIPSLTGRSPPGNDERDLLALPPRLGGLGLVNPTKEVEIEQANSQHVTAPLVTNIVEQNENISDIKEEMKQRKREAHNSKCKHQQEAATALKSELPAALLRSAELATEEGASSWITAIPLDWYGFTLHKGAYRDALCLRYGWSPPMLASQCVCGQLFTIAHALSCPTGGYPSIRHNELRDITADLLKEVCSDVTVKPPLQPLTGEVVHENKHSWRGSQIGHQYKRFLGRPVRTGIF